MFLAAFVSFLSFFVDPRAGPRFGLGTGSLFAAAANSFVVVSSLPDNSTLTLADKLQIATIVLIFCGLATSTISLKLANDDKADFAKSIDLGAFLILFSGYVGAIYCILKF